MDMTDLKIYVTLLICSFIVIGVSGNIVSIIVWTKGPRCSKTLFTFFFKILAISDIFVLLVPGTEFLLHYNPSQSISFRNINNSLCRFFNFSVNFGFEFSAWITVMLTFERTLALFLPFKFYKPSRKLMVCRFFTVFVIILVLVVANISYIINIEIVYTYEINEIGNSTEEFLKQMCYFSSESSAYTFMVTVLCFHIGIPVPLTIICNVIIIVKLCRRNNLTTVSNNVRNKSIKHLTILTVCISIIHCLSTLPETLFWLDVISRDEHNMVLSNVCLYFNNSLHCLLYCLVGSEFRHDLKHICNNIVFGKCCEHCRTKENVILLEDRY